MVFSWYNEGQVHGYKINFHIFSHLWLDLKHELIINNFLIP